MEKDRDSIPESDVTTWLQQLRSDDEEERKVAARRLDERLAKMLKGKIREGLNARVAQRVGTSDIYQELMLSFFRGMEEGEYRLSNRDALLALLYRMIRNKVINARLHHRAKMRDVRREVRTQDESDEDGGGRQGSNQLKQGTQEPFQPIARHQRRNLAVSASDVERGDSWFAGKEMIDLLTYGADQGDAVIAEEVYDTVKASLPTERGLDTIFDRILAGYSDAEIAKELGKTIARVRQLTADLRQRMEAMGVAPDDRKATDEERDEPPKGP